MDHRPYQESLRNRYNYQDSDEYSESRSPPRSKLHSDWSPFGHRVPTPT